MKKFYLFALLSLLTCCIGKKQKVQVEGETMDTKTVSTQPFYFSYLNNFSSLNNADKSLLKLFKNIPNQLDQTILFTRASEPDIKFIDEENYYLMVFEGLIENTSNHLSNWAIFSASSPDGVSWEYLNEGRPIISIKDSFFEKYLFVAEPAILKLNDRFVLFTTANQKNEKSITSFDLIYSESLDGVKWENHQVVLDPTSRVDVDTRNVFKDNTIRHCSNYQYKSFSEPTATTIENRLYLIGEIELISQETNCQNNLRVIGGGYLSNGSLNELKVLYSHHGDIAGPSIYLQENGFLYVSTSVTNGASQIINLEILIEDMEVIEDEFTELNFKSFPIKKIGDYSFVRFYEPATFWINGELNYKFGCYYQYQNKLLGGLVSYSQSQGWFF
ncbi:MAG: hypothetical protein HOE90_09140 [Bacteriovoracaceae bacterium]|nr:hypothetical protein [Bacteriovoracaceae bacterium]